MVARIRFLVLALVVALLVSGVSVYAYPWTLVSKYYVIQPTNPSISSTNTQGYLAQLPQCYISSNPYSGGYTGTFGLFNCVAINYGAISAVVWFYEPSGGQGVLLWFSSYQFPSKSGGYAPWFYIGKNGILYAGDWVGSFWQVSTSSALSPGWHMAVVEEWASSTSGPYYIALYLDGLFVGQISTSSLPQLFGSGTTYPYSDIGAGYGGTWPNTNGAWFFFNGTIAYVAVYNTVLSQSQVQALYQAGFPNELFSQNLVVAYLLVNNTAIYQGPPPLYTGSWSNYYFVPWFVNYALLNQAGITNPQAITITPSGSQGLVPETQFLGPIPNNLFSWCRLLQSVSVSMPSSVYVNQSFNVNVQLTTITQMQYELPYYFMVGINGTNESSVLRVDAWVFSSDAINGYVFANNSSLTAPPKPGNYTVVVSLPVCNMVWTKQITVDPPPSNTTSTTGNTTNNTGSLSSSSSSSSSSNTPTTSLSTLSTTLIDALNTVVQYLVNPVVAVVVVLIVAVAYILYRRREIAIRL